MYKDLPANTHFKIEALINYPKDKEHQTEWAYTYLLLKKGSNIKNIESNIDGFMQAHVPKDQLKTSAIHFTPLTDIHLYSHIEREIEPNGDIKQIKLLVLAAIAILIIVFINNINLAQATINKRGLTIYVNQLLGAKKTDTFRLLFTESFFVALLSTLAGLLLMPVIRILLSTLGIAVNFEFSAFLFPQFTIILVLFLLVFSVPGALPIVFVNLKLINVFAIPAKAGSISINKVFLNKPMLVVQFVISIVVIICSLIFKQQNNYALSKGLGHNQQNSIVVYRSFWAEEPEVMSFIEEIKTCPYVEEATACMDEPSSLVKDMRGFECSGVPPENKEKLLTIMPCDENFLPFFDIKLIAGTYPNIYKEGQKKEDYVLNKTALKFLGFNSAEEAIGMKFKLQDWLGVIHGGNIVGVVDDFNFSSLYHKIQPTVYFQKPIWHWRYLLKLNTCNVSDFLPALQKIWDNHYPQHPFDYEHISKLYAKTYQQDVMLSRIVSVLAWLAIVISAIGLFGMAEVMADKKTKEIGIRKVTRQNKGSANPYEPAIYYLHCVGLML
ncbi:MAG: FtsX-like permease family protein, partial [Bacteroidales bacterium]|nr:FtsX-like permease family protein [Bacteroidales bacterium]